MEALWLDVRYALRSLRRSKGFVSCVLTVLAPGIAVNSSVFSIVNAALKRSFPYSHGDQLVSVDTVRKGSASGTGESSYRRRNVGWRFSTTTVR